MAQVRQSRPDSGRGFQVKVFKYLRVAAAGGTGREVAANRRHPALPGEVNPINMFIELIFIRLIGTTASHQEERRAG